MKYFKGLYFLLENKQRVLANLVTCVFLITYSLSDLKAESAPRIVTAYIYAIEGESLESLLIDRVGASKEVLYEKGYYANILRWNPRIEDEQNLSSDEKIYIELPFSPELKLPIDQTKELPARLYYTVSLRLNKWDFSQKQQNEDIVFEQDYSALMLTGHAQTSYFFKGSHLGGVLNLEADLIPLSSDSFEDATARKITIGALGQYDFLIRDSPWTINIRGGLRFSRMFVSDDLFGHGGVISSKYALKFKRQFSEFRLLSLSTRWSFLSRNFGFNFDEREIGFSAGWSIQTEEGKAWKLLFDFSSEKFFLKQGSEVNSERLSLGLSYFF